MGDSESLDSSWPSYSVMFSGVRENWTPGEPPWKPGGETEPGLPSWHQSCLISSLLVFIRALYSDTRSFLPSTMQVLLGRGRYLANSHYNHRLRISRYQPTCSPGISPCAAWTAWPAPRRKTASLCSTLTSTLSLKLERSNCGVPQMNELLNVT